MPNCASCGAPLPESAAADQNPRCDACRIAAAQRTVDRYTTGATTSSAPARKVSVTRLIVVANVLVFLMMAWFGVSARHPSSTDILIWGGNEAVLTLVYGQYWRLWTATYVHIGFVHLALNMWCLYNLGRLAEMFYSQRFLFAAYTFAGITSSLLSVALHPFFPRVPSAGASGAIMGVAGLLFASLRWGHLPIAEEPRKALYKNILEFAGITIFFGFAMNLYSRAMGAGGGIDNAAHVGGLLFGMLTGAMVGKHLSGSAEDKAYRRKVWWSLGLFVLVLFFLILMWRLGLRVGFR